MTWGSATLRISGATVQAANDSRPDEMYQWRQRRHAANRLDERFGVLANNMHPLRIATGLRVRPGLMLIGHADIDRHHLVRNGYFQCLANGGTKLPRSLWSERTR